VDFLLFQDKNLLIVPERMYHRSVLWVKTNESWQPTRTPPRPTYLVTYLAAFTPAGRNSRAELHFILVVNV